MLDSSISKNMIKCRIYSKVLLKKDNLYFLAIGVSDKILISALGNAVKPFDVNLLFTDTIYEEFKIESKYWPTEKSTEIYIFEENQIIKLIKYKNEIQKVVFYKINTNIKYFEYDIESNFIIVLTQTKELFLIYHKTNYKFYISSNVNKFKIVRFESRISLDSSLIITFIKDKQICTFYFPETILCENLNFQIIDALFELSYYYILLPNKILQKYKKESEKTNFTIKPIFEIENVEDFDVIAGNIYYRTVDAVYLKIKEREEFKMFESKEMKFFQLFNIPNKCNFILY